MNSNTTLHLTASFFVTLHYFIRAYVRRLLAATIQLPDLTAQACGSTYRVPCAYPAPSSLQPISWRAKWADKLSYGGLPTYHALRSAREMYILPLEQRTSVSSRLRDKVQSLKLLDAGLGRTGV